MKNQHSCFRPGVWAVAIACLLPSPARAADRTARFVVPDSQIQAFDIRSALLGSESNAIKAQYPALVVIPPQAEQVVSAPVAGLVAQLLVQQNQNVRAGAALVRIVSPELGQQQLQLLQAAARAALARQTSQREQQLFDDGIIPRRRVQEAQAALQESTAALNHARAGLRLSGMSAASIERVTASGLALDSITLTAPKAGIVTLVAVKPGQRVDAATSLVHLAQTDVLWLDAQLPVAESGNWPAGSRIELPGSNLTARVMSVSPIASSASQTVVLRAAVEGGTGRLRPGAFVTIELPIAADPGSRDVPLSAVAHEGNQAYVFVRVAGGFEARPVKVVSGAGQRLRVQGRLAAEEKIAISGVVALKGAWLDATEGK